ncbi:MAG: tRNA (adenosine(37)-N6)-threonylcarbamoyltransferase complex transferase subunit TsaD [Planctomycetes bacterium]|nr:tRNA (adenosine(37)-N6)-threonylcarbamoyltransferase complex transferase subunit TsaD [Planctomycetota bacterium]MBI3834732.1 tRNA (adenosine(37)-N6)-threonylcarbamoyltransferase complex transferase subunit TsaD [Planctomycetota bacterium]
MTTVLGIETSCDETSAAIVVDGREVRSNIVASQFDLHAKYGGVVPEIAARAHIERLDSVIEEAMSVAGVTANDIDVIAVTNRPGLVGALLIGVTAAKTLAWAWNKPLVAVDHIRAHAYSTAIEMETPPFPAIGLIVSGGHSSLFHIKNPTSIELLGATTDDAAGEAFDKVAVILGLPFPGGPWVEKVASGIFPPGEPGTSVRAEVGRVPPADVGARRDSRTSDPLFGLSPWLPSAPLGKGGGDGEAGRASPTSAVGRAVPTHDARPGNPHAIDFPRTWLTRDSLDFSFSGIKTAVMYHVHGQGKTSGGLEKLSPGELADIAASFQQAMIDMLIKKTMLAVKRTGLKTVVLGGGVAANKTLRRALEAECVKCSMQFHAAKMAYCTDNGAMIAALGYHQFIAGDVADLNIEAYPSTV